jgi:hypothetical protein
MMMRARPEPFASFRIESANESDIERQTLRVDLIITALGYSVQPSRAEAFKGMPQQSAWLARTLAEERDYAEGRFHITLSPEHETASLWVYFYEYERDQFTEEGIARFEKLRTKIEAAGLPVSFQAANARPHARVGKTPQQFNSEHPARTLADRVSELIPTIVMLLVYMALLVFPGLLLLKIAVMRLVSGPIRQRLALSLVASVVLAPMPMPMTIVGPALFIPNVLFMPALGSIGLRFWPWMLGSIILTFAVAYFGSRYVIRINDDETEYSRRR